MNPYPEPIDAWKKEIECFMGTSQYRELDRIDRQGADGIRVEKIPRIHYITDSRRDPEKLCTKCTVNLSNSQNESSSCHCTMTVFGEKKETKNYVLRVPEPWQEMLKDSRKDIGRFSLGMIGGYLADAHPCRSWPQGDPHGC